MSEFKQTERQQEATRLIGSGPSHIQLEGGSRSGKTFEILRVIALRAIAAPMSRHAVVRFRFNHVKASIVNDTWPKMMRLCFPGVGYRLNKEDWFAKLDNGSEVWFSGLDDKDRTEKMLGNEYATVFLNETSQISYASRAIMMTRLAQKVTYEKDGTQTPLRLLELCDCNPPSKAHWSYKLFHEKKEPDTGTRLKNPENYAWLQMNPRDNLDNLPPQYLEELAAMAPRLRKRFLYGEYSEATPNALWTEEGLEKAKVDEVPELIRVVVGVDPSGAGETDNSDNDEIGIIVAGLGTDGVGYILEDTTVKAGPAQWGAVAVSAYDRHEADRVCGEENFGGAMVQFVIQTARPNTPYRKVTASRGKHLRAEPISALMETGKLKMLGDMPKLEAEMCAMSTSGYTGDGSPNRLDAAVIACTDLFPGVVAGRKKRDRIDYGDPRKRGIV